MVLNFDGIRGVQRKLPYHLPGKLSYLLGLPLVERLARRGFVFRQSDHGRQPQRLAPKATPSGVSLSTKCILLHLGYRGANSLTNHSTTR